MRQQQPAGDQIIVDIRFHGNYSIPDATLLEATGVSLGEPLTPTTLADIEQRLRAHRGVGDVEIRKRYRSMENTHDVVLLIVIKEHVAAREKLMFLPAFTWTDEYGVTYGARVTMVDLLGAGERVSFPLTWGGEKQAMAELTFDLGRPAITRIDGGFGMRRRENPHFELDDTRIGGWVAAIKRWEPFELRGTLSAATVDFGGSERNQLEYGLGARIDTRQDALLPRDAVYAGVAWDRLHLFSPDSGVNRYTVDLRGYKALVGHTVVASQAYYRGADARLPDWERPFLGGARTVRGYDAGEFIGDNIVLLSAEWRVPLTPPVPAASIGLDFFFDSGAVYDHGTALGRARFRNGAGAGMYFFVAFIGLQIDVAYGFADEAVHVHFSTGFRF